MTPDNQSKTLSRPSRVTLGKIVLLLLSTATVVWVAERTLRLAGFPAPRLLTPDTVQHYHISPGNSFLYEGYLVGNYVDFTNMVHLNRAGFHDRDREPSRATPTTYRIMVLGDSYVENLSVPIERLFTSQLESQFNREQPLGQRDYEIIPVGHGHRSQKDQIQWLRQMGPDYTPNAVLLVFFCGNDVMENSQELNQAACKYADGYKQTIYPRKIRLFQKLLLFPHSRVNGLFAETVTRLYITHLDKFDPTLTPADLISPEIGVYQTPLREEWLRAFASTATYLAQLKETCASLNAPLLVTCLSSPQAIGDASADRLWKQESPGIDLQQPERWLQTWCLTNQVPLLNLGPALNRTGKHRVFWRHDGHLNPVGNDVVAQELYHFLVENSMKQPLHYAQ